METDFAPVISDMSKELKNFTKESNATLEKLDQKAAETSARLLAIEQRLVATMVGRLCPVERDDPRVRCHIELPTGRGAFVSDSRLVGALDDLKFTEWADLRGGQNLRHYLSLIALRMDHGEACELMAGHVAGDFLAVAVLAIGKACVHPMQVVVEKGHPE